MVCNMVVVVSEPVKVISGIKNVNLKVFQMIHSHNKISCSGAPSILHSSFLSFMRQLVALQMNDSNKARRIEISPHGHYSMRTN